MRRSQCVACKKWEKRYDLKVFARQDYDFTCQVVQRVFAQAVLEQKKIQYVCVPCQTALSSPSNPHMPEVFVKRDCGESVECLCTCCHQKFQRNGVYEFRVCNYDFDHPIVEECLNGDVRMKNSIHEYICKECHKCLRIRKFRGIRYAVTRPANAFGINFRRDNEWSIDDWNDILSKMYTMTSYQMLEQYVQQLHIPDIVAICGNVHLPGYERDLVAFNSIPDDHPFETDSLFPVYTKGYGNCLPNSLSRAVYGNELHAAEMRVRLVYEGIRNIDLYLDDDYLKRAYVFPYREGQSLAGMYCFYGACYKEDEHDLKNRAVVKQLYKEEMFQVRKDGTECGIWQLQQAANILHTPVYTMHPHMPLRQLRADLNRIILPAEDSYLMDEPIIIMWTKCAPGDNRFGHFVPVVTWDKTLHWNDRNVWRGSKLIDNFVSSQNKEQSLKFTCTCCHKIFATANRVVKFQKKKYNFDNPIVRDALSGEVRCQSSNGIEYICRPCYIKLRRSKSTLPSMPVDAVAEKCGKWKKRKEKNIRCTACHHLYCDGGNVNPFNIDRYNFENSIVQEALHNDMRCNSDNGKEYICRRCDESLSKEEPSMPRMAFCKKCREIDMSNEITVAGEKFERCNKEFKRCVCTVCHRKLFKKSANKFNEKYYDMKYEDVAKSLSARFRYISEDGIEYICGTCQRNLKKKRMPCQAVANQLELPDIPEELQGLSRLEVRCISKRIPFMSVQPLRKGGQGKINGPCINVPATLEPITTHVLPRVPEDAHVILVKLKRMLVYKSDYLYDRIHPQKVMEALRWLKRNNPYYEDIAVDEDWPDKIQGHVLCHSDDDDKTEVDAEDDNMEQHEEDEEEYMGKDGECGDMEVDESVPSDMNKDGECEDMEVDESVYSDMEDEECCKEMEEKENDMLEEEQMEINRRAEITVEPSTTCLQVDDLESTAFAIAPGEGSIPKYILQDEDFEVLSFPQFFPGGFGGYETLTPRRSSLDMRRYINQRLLNIDSRFSRDAEYIFAFQYATELQQLKNDMQIMLKRTRNSGHVGAINAGNLQCMEFRTKLLYTDNAYHFMGNVRGTPAYWQKQMYDVLAMLRSLGTPTWFLTLSPAEFRWPEFSQAVGVTYGEEWSVDDVAAMEWKDKAKYFRENPITICEMYQKRVEDFFKDFLCSKAHPIGEITHHCEKIEFQVRGSPHAHCLIWVKDAPKVDEATDEEVCNFVDKYVSGSIPPEGQEHGYVRQLVMEVQRHAHSLACKKFFQSVCRFKFPKAPCMKTIISRQPGTDELATLDINENAHILQSVREGIEKHPDWRIDEILKSECIPEERYIQSLQVASRSGTEVILRRDTCDMNVNNYNYHCLKYWNANMDIQYIANPYSCIMYVLNYVMKAEKGMSQLLKEVSKEFAHEGLREQMKKVASSFLNKREVSIQESAMRVLGMWLFRKNIAVVYVHNGQRAERPRMPLPLHKLQALADNDENVYYVNCHERYAARPDNLERLCLADFAVWYTVEYGDPKKTDGIIWLKNDKGLMRKRKEKAILRCHSYKKNTEEYFYSKLLLFLPWRNEDQDMLNGYCSYREHYNHVLEAVELKAEEYNLHVEDIDRALEEVNNCPPEDSEWLTATTREDEFRKENVGEVDINIEEDQTGEKKKKETKKVDRALSLKYKAEALKKTITSEEYRGMMRGLNREQKQIVMFNRHWVKEAIWRKKLGLKVHGYKVFLSGPGGTGKSHVIKMIYRDNVHMFRLACVLESSDAYLCRRNLDEEVIALLTAFTGTASFNIFGTTLHQAFQLYQDDRLRSEKANAMETRLSLLQHVTIDEVSMVSSKNLDLINQRCTTVKHGITEEQEFGNVSVLAVGDLYQLPPVGGTFPFMLYDEGNSVPIWYKFYLHELVQIMRQKDRKFAELLNKIRTARPGVNSDEEKMLKKRVLKLPEDHPEYPKYALHVYATNAYADMRNEKILSGLDSHLFICKAQDSVQARNISIRDIIMPKKPGKTGNLREALMIKVDARVMMTTNVDVTDGLTNGAYGTVKHIVRRMRKDNDGVEYESDEVHAILVHFDNERAGVQAKQRSPYKEDFPLAVPVYRVDISFLVKGKKTVQVTRRNFPLALAWAVTIHKTQGQTVDEIVVDMDLDKGKFTAGQAYVAFSRVTTYEKLHILNYTRAQIKVSPNVAKEMRRLRRHRLPELKAPLIMHIEEEYLRVGHLNVQGLGTGTRSKLPDLLHDESVQHLDVLCLTETHLSQGTSFEASSVWAEKNGSVLQYNRAGEQGGGVAVLVSDKYKCHEYKVNIEGQRNVEAVAVKINTKPRTVIVAVYIRPQADRKACVEVMKSIVNSVADYEQVILIGDFNENVLITDKCHHVRDFLVERGFVQHINLPTTDYASSLDHVYTRGGTNVKCDVVDTYYSDHDTVFCFLR